MKKGKRLRKRLAMLLAIVMIIGFLPGVGSLEVSAAEGNTITGSKPAGDGTAENPYQIGTAEELDWFADKVNNENKTYKDASAVLTADITVNTGVLDENGELASNTSGFVKWIPIGTKSCKFKGTFDGQNHTISGLYFNDDAAEYVGLIGYLNMGKVSNVGVADSYFNGKNYVGGVCGYMFDSTMSDCYNAGHIKGTGYVGGGVGECVGLAAEDILIQKCYNTGIVTGTDYIGGVCGNMKHGTITACYNTGKIDGSENVGGICGYLDDCIMNKCYFDKAYANTVIGGYAPDSDVIIDNDGHGKTTDEMHQADFCKLITYESYQNGICTLCQEAYQEAVRTEDKYDIDGDGKKDVVYEIGNAGQLYWFADKVNNDNDTYKNANAVLTADITVNTGVLDDNGNPAKDTKEFKNWTPIGTVNYKYQGTFDGQNHTISGLYYDNLNYVGLFGYLDSGSILNVGVIDSYFNGLNYPSGLCSWNSMGTIMNCYYAGTVKGSLGVGGICGYNDDSVIKNCYNAGTISGSSESSCVGGICGYNCESVVDNCYNVGTVEGGERVGGVSGFNRGTIKNCYSIDDIDGSLYVGGVCGHYMGGTVMNCYYNSSVNERVAIGLNEGTTVTMVERKTTEQFQSGEVAYLLQDGQEAKTEVVWGQKIGTDSYPVLGGSNVCRFTIYEGCESKPGNVVAYKYSNADKDQNIYASHIDDGSLEGSVAYDNRCDFCGKELHTFNEDGSCKDAGCVYHKGIITNVSYPTKIVYSGDVANAEPKAGDFAVASGKEPVFTWYQGDVTTDNLPKNSLGAAPKEAGTYTLVVNAEGAEKDGIVYTAAERRIKVTIEKEPIKNTETEPKKEETTTPQPSGTTEAQQPSGTNTTQQPNGTTTTQPSKEESEAPQPSKNGDVVTDNKTKAKFEVTDVSKKEVTYNAPVDNKEKDIIIPDTVTINGEVYKVTKIADNAFKGNKTVTNITIGSNIQTIGNNAFKGCKKLKTIIIKSKTLTDKKISKKAFKGISKKTVIKVPKKKMAAYKKLLKKKGLSSKNKIKGY